MSANKIHYSTYFNASALMRPKALMTESRISTTSHRNRGIINLYIAVESPLALSLRSTFIESGEELCKWNKFKDSIEYYRRTC